MNTNICILKNIMKRRKVKDVFLASISENVDGFLETTWHKKEIKLSVREI